MGSSSRPLAVEAGFGKWGNSGIIENERYGTNFMIQLYFIDKRYMSTSIRSVHFFRNINYRFYYVIWKYFFYI